ncbi:MAG: hypothetical protein M3Q81_01810 [bacterium]|nr:hypothetical protein [bacterium]
MSSKTSQFIPILLVLPIEADHPRALTEWLAEQAISSSNNPAVSSLNLEDKAPTIEQVRNLITDLSYTSYTEQSRWFLLTHIDDASTAAQNALLKTLEEPPANTHLLLTVTQANKVLPTITSRCQVLQWQPPENSLNQVVLPSVMELWQRSFGELIELLAEYTDRQTAKQLLAQWLGEIRQLSEYPSSQLLTAAQVLAHASQDLDTAVNVRLCLERYAFEVKQVLSS